MNMFFKLNKFNQQEDVIDLTAIFAQLVHICSKGESFSETVCKAVCIGRGQAGGRKQSFVYEVSLHVFTVCVYPAMFIQRPCIQ